MPTTRGELLESAIPKTSSGKLESFILDGKSSVPGRSL